MFKKLFKKEFAVEGHIREYLDNINLTRDRFQKAFEVYLNKGLCGDFDFFLKQTHKAESRADDVRYQIQSLMYEKALIPDSRGDILGFLEALDEVPGQMQRILFLIKTQQIVTPDFLVPNFKELIEISLNSCDVLFNQVISLLESRSDIKSKMAEIDQMESLCDHIERRLITDIFQSDLDPFCKLQLRDVVVHIGDISDFADRVSRRVYIISCKRKV